MNIPIKKDKRFKVTKEIVQEIRELRKQNKTLQYIADRFNVGTSTIRYWTDDGYRLKMREKNAKRKSTNKQRYKNRNESTKEYTRNNCLGYIEKYVNDVKYKPKYKKYTLFGQSPKFWETLIENENKFGYLKID